MKLAALSLLLAMLPAFQASPKKHKYTGPQCLSGFCFEGGSKKKLADAFGKIPKKETLYCYKTSDSKAYLQYQIDDEYRVNRKVFTIGAISITDFPSCAVKPSLLTSSSAQVEWKTPEGIGLGSLEKDIVRAYGKPVERETVTAKDIAALMMVGEDGDPKNVPANAGDTVLTYKSDFADLSLAWIVLRKGKVSGIRLADVE
jgi:hypothetical protein